MRTLGYTIACVGALSALLIDPRSALAQKRYRVTIDTEPEGAKVWIDERDGDPDGETPYTTRLTEGRHTVFLEQEGYEIAVHEISVKARKGKAKQSFRYELIELRYGTIDVLAAEGEEDQADGAKVLVDGEEKGTVPDSFEAAEGPHQVEVVKEGFKRFEAWIEVKKGESVEVSVSLQPTSGGAGGDQGDDPDKGDDPDRGDDPDKGGGDKGGGTDKGGRTGPILRFGAGMGAGVRRFAYENPATNNLRPYNANTIALVDVGAELYLGGLTSALRRFSLFGGASLSLPMESNTAAGNEAIDTRWFRREAGARARLAAGPGHLGLDLAEGGNAFTFQNAGLLADEIPEVRYEYLRAGVWYGVESPRTSFGAGADGLWVFSSKGVAERFTNPSVLAGRAHAWFRRLVWSGLEASLSGSLTYFKYSLEPGPAHAADGGYDLMLDLILGAGYRF